MLLTPFYCLPLLLFAVNRRRFLIRRYQALILRRAVNADISVAFISCVLYACMLYALSRSFTPPVGWWITMVVCPRTSHGDWQAGRVADTRNPIWNNLTLRRAKVCGCRRRWQSSIVWGLTSVQWRALAEWMPYGSEVRPRPWTSAQWGYRVFRGGEATFGNPSRTGGRLGLRDNFIHLWIKTWA